MKFNYDTPNEKASESKRMDQMKNGQTVDGLDGWNDQIKLEEEFDAGAGQTLIGCR